MIPAIIGDGILPNTGPVSPCEPLTMSSREIAELTGKRHDHVMRDIRNMLESLSVPDLPRFGGVCIDGKGERRPLFNLPKRETMILVSGYSVTLRARIVVAQLSPEFTARDQMYLTISGIDWAVKTFGPKAN